MISPGQSRISEYMNYSSLKIRDKLGSKVRYLLKKSPINAGVTWPFGFYMYNIERFRFTHLLLKELELRYPGQSKSTLEDPVLYNPVLYEITAADLKHVRLEAACCAWLSWDNKTLEQQGVPADQLPGNLSYGLVLSYPEPIMRAACYLVGETKESELLSIDPETHYQAEQFALQRLKEAFPTLNKEDLENITRQQKHSLAEKPT